MSNLYFSGTVLHFGKQTLKVKFVHRSKLIKVLHHLSNLTDSEQKFKKYIGTMDGNENQRKSIKNLYLEAKEKSSTSENTLCRVRGSSYKPRILVMEKNDLILIPLMVP